MIAFTLRYRLYECERAIIITGAIVGRVITLKEAIEKSKIFQIL